MTLVMVEANGKKDYEEAFAAARRARVQALFVLTTIPNFTNRNVVGELVVKHRLPTVHDQSVYVEAGE